MVWLTRIYIGSLASISIRRLQTSVCSPDLNLWVKIVTFGWALVYEGRHESQRTLTDFIYSEHNVEELKSHCTKDVQAPLLKTPTNRESRNYLLKQITEIQKIQQQYAVLILPHQMQSNLKSLSSLLKASLNPLQSMSCWFSMQLSDCWLRNLGESRDQVVLNMTDN